METIIQTTALTKCYHKNIVVKELDLNIPSGSIYGFLGPNGAGKSTTMKMLLGLVKPTEGSITIMGKKLTNQNRLHILKNTGSLIESPAYYGHLSGRENLMLIASFKQVEEKQVEDALAIVHLKDHQHKKVSQYSLGMKQRLGIAAALLGYPPILLLDEPTNGLDPAGIQEMRELICTLPQKYGITVLVSSHLLSEIDQMATHVGIINKGILIFQDRLSVLHERSHSRIRLRTTDNHTAYQLLQQNHISSTWDNNALYLTTPNEKEVLRSGFLLLQSDIGIFRMEEEQKSLEDIFLNLVGRSI